MIHYLAAHHALTMSISVVALLLALALGGWSVGQWLSPPSRSIRREPTEAVSWAVPAIWTLPVDHRPTLTLPLAGILSVFIVRDQDVEHAPAADVPVKHAGADLDWSPREWLDGASEPDDPTLGTGDVLASQMVRVTATGDFDGVDGSAPTDGRPLAERLADDGRDDLTRELDAIMARAQTGLDRIMDDLTERHPWLLADDSWCVCALDWSPAWLATAPRELVSA